MKKIECVIMDWAGTAVDYGCFAPVAAFLKAFAEKGLTVTMEEARGPMGMTKIDHIRELFKLPSVTEQFKQNYNRNWTEEDVVSIYKEFEKHLFASLEEYDSYSRCNRSNRETEKGRHQDRFHHRIYYCHDGHCAARCRRPWLYHRQLCDFQQPSGRTPATLHDLPEHD